MRSGTEEQSEIEALVVALKDVLRRLNALREHAAAASVDRAIYELGFTTCEIAPPEA